MYVYISMIHSIILDNVWDISWILPVYKQSLALISIFFTQLQFLQEILCVANYSSDTVEVDLGLSWEVTAL